MNKKQIELRAAFAILMSARARVLAQRDLAADKVLRSALDPIQDEIRSSEPPYIHWAVCVDPTVRPGSWVKF